jgi:hypothetical protein
MMTGYLADKSTGDVAADQYHHYKVSVQIFTSNFYKLKHNG